MGAAAGRRLSRLALAALATLVVIIATASACENEELNRLVEEAPPPGATIAIAQQDTSGRIEPPERAAILYEVPGDLPREDRVSLIMAHAKSVGWRFAGREQDGDKGAVTLTFVQGDYKADYRINHESLIGLPECDSPWKELYSLACFDSIRIKKR